MIWWTQLNRKQKFRRLSVALLTTPIVMFIIPLWAAFHEPSLLVEFWQFYALFFALPFGMSLALWIWSTRVDQA